MSDRRKRRGGLLAAVLWGALACGCTSFGLHLTPRPTPKGKLELGVNADIVVLDRGFGYFPFPQPELAIRYGLSERVDIGGRVNLLGIAANSRILLWTPHGTEISVVPGLALGFVPATNADTGMMHTSGTLDLLVGLPLRDRWDLVWSLRSQYQLQYGPAVFLGASDSLKFVTLVGGGFGVRFPVGKTIYLFPELNVFAPYDAKRDEWQPPLFQFGLAIEWGRTCPDPRGC